MSITIIILIFIITLIVIVMIIAIKLMTQVELDLIREVQWKWSRAHTWQKGDLLVLDNQVVLFVVVDLFALKIFVLCDLVFFLQKSGSRSWQTWVLAFSHKEGCRCHH